jgi:hypothetical protein
MRMCWARDLELILTARLVGVGPPTHPELPVVNNFVVGSLPYSPQSSAAITAKSFSPRPERWGGSKAAYAAVVAGSGLRLDGIMRGASRFR